MILPIFEGMSSYTLMLWWAALCAFRYLVRSHRKRDEAALALGEDKLLLALEILAFVAWAVIVWECAGRFAMRLGWL